MTLETWLDHGWLKRHDTSPQEIADLLAVVDRALENAAVVGLTSDARIGLAYPAALAVGAVALAASGARVPPTRDFGHRRHHAAVERAAA